MSKWTFWCRCMLANGTFSYPVFPLVPSCEWISHREILLSFSCVPPATLWLEVPRGIRHREQRQEREAGPCEGTVAAWGAPAWTWWARTPFWRKYHLVKTWRWEGASLCSVAENKQEKKNLEPINYLISWTVCFSQGSRLSATPGARKHGWSLRNRILICTWKRK